VKVVANDAPALPTTQTAQNTVQNTSSADCGGNVACEKAIQKVMQYKAATTTANTPPLLSSPRTDAPVNLGAAKTTESPVVAGH
jgi:hypothetical protein